MKPCCHGGTTASPCGPSFTLPLLLLSDSLQVVPAKIEPTPEGLGGHRGEGASGQEGGGNTQEEETKVEILSLSPQAVQESIDILMLYMQL